MLEEPGLDQPTVEEDGDARSPCDRLDYTGILFLDLTPMIPRTNYFVDISQVGSLSADLKKARDDVVYYQHMSEQQASDLISQGTDLSWLTSTGVAACVRAVLRSDTFGKSCASLQEASFCLGQASAYDF